MTSGPRALSILATTLTCMLAGCGSDDGLNRVEVYGDVSLAGAPVVDGQIRFIPQDGTPGPIIIQSIQDGEYRCDHQGGVPAGTHRVEILVWDPNVPAPRGPGVPPRPQWAAAEFNTESKLTALIEDNGDPVRLDFSL